MKIDLQNYWGEREIYDATELTSKIIHSMQKDGNVYLHTKEGKNGEVNGLYKILDDLCKYWGWDKQSITIETANYFSSHDEYNVIFSGFHANHPAKFFSTTDPLASEWTREKLYGMFIARPDVNRIRAVHLHKKFKYSDQGLTSFHGDLFEFMGYPDLVDYFMHSGQTYQEMISIKPYSDIGPLMKSPIMPPYNSIGWGPTYSKIAIDLVCEVTTQAGNVDFSEKTMRPIYHKRPFLIIGPPNTLIVLRKLGFKTFEGIIPEDYDQLQGIPRVDRVFSILQKLIDDNTIYSIIEQSRDILEYNHNHIKQFCEESKKYE
jgi:hypothetical protein